MNIDFHYYATFVAACFAGYTLEEAQQIAYVAQYVDVEDSDKLKGNSKLSVISTVQSTISSGTDIREKALKNSHQIWTSFHFLPGNLDEHIEYTGDKEWQKGSFDFVSNETISYSYVTPDMEHIKSFKRLCLKNSKLVEEMIHDTKKNFEKNLEMIGLRMHVLADTWAHEYFTGTRDWWVNDINELAIKAGKKGYSSIPAITASSAFYLGHARVGHLPDDASANYEYIPKWSNEKIQKNNKEVFQNAFWQMKNAMDYIRNNKPFVMRDGRDEIFPSGFDKEKKDRFIQLFEIKDYSVENWCKDWKQYIKSEFEFDLPDFDASKLAREYSNKEDNPFIRFNNAAINQIEFVKERLSKASADIK